jgi:hypothetical protein
MHDLFPRTGLRDKGVPPFPDMCDMVHFDVFRGTAYRAWGVEGSLSSNVDPFYTIEVVPVGGPWERAYFRFRVAEEISFPSFYVFEGSPDIMVPFFAAGWDFFSS